MPSDAGYGPPSSPPRAALRAAADQFGTPTYVIDTMAVDAAADRIETAFGGSWLRHYSLKANDLSALVARLSKRGWGANVVSSGEWSHAARAGASDRNITLEGIGKTDADLEAAVASVCGGGGIRWIVVESADELAALRAVAHRHRIGVDRVPPLDVLFRINPAVQPHTLPGLAVGAATSKFGCTADEILTLVSDGIGEHLRVRGIHVHAGSDLRSVDAWVDAGVSAVRLLQRISSIAPTADTVDFGGGFPLLGGSGPTPTQFHDTLVDAVAAADLSMPTRCAIEPGRHLVGDAGWLVSRVLHTRARGPHPQQVVLDAGMTELLRPALYGSHHEVVPLLARPVGPLLETAVHGPICESTDSLGLHQLPVMRRGDLVALASVGAYGASFTSRYNGRPQPVEVLLMPDGTLKRADRPQPGRISNRCHGPETQPLVLSTVGHSPTRETDPC